MSCDFVQMCSLTVEMMKEKGLTEGAAKKLHKKLEELRLVAQLMTQYLPPPRPLTES